MVFLGIVLVFLFFVLGVMLLMAIASMSIKKDDQEKGGE
jgi:hypothetical protein